MNVKQLIALLKQCEPEQEITVWDAYHDCSSSEVEVSFSLVDHTVHIGNHVFGTAILPKKKTTTGATMRK